MLCGELFSYYSCRCKNQIFDLNQKYNKLVTEEEEVSRNIHWSVKNFGWDNLFNYGEQNSIDFEKLEGIVGIFGKNYSGKSSIVDTLLYSLYNSTSKSIRKNLNIINQNRDDCRAAATIKIDDNEYVVTLDGGSWQAEVTWEIVDAAGAVVLSGGAPITVADMVTVCLANDGTNGYYLNMID